MSTPIRISGHARIATTAVATPATSPTLSKYSFAAATNAPMTT